MWTPGEDTDHLSTGELLGQWLSRMAGRPINGQTWRVADPLDRGSRFVEGPVGEDFTVIGEPRVGGQAAVARGVLAGYGEPIAIRVMLASTDPKAHQRERLQVAIGQLSRAQRHALPALVQTLGSVQISVAARDFHHPDRLAQPGSSTVEVWAHLLQWCPGTLAEELNAQGGRGLGAEQMVRRLLPVMRTLHGMHSLGYIHRDLDPSNILVAEDGSLQVADFGIAVHMNVNNTHTMTEAWGKQGRMPPEALQGKQVPVGPSYDAWQVGFIVAETATGARPVLPGGAISPRVGDLPKPVRSVVRELLEPDRERRLAIPAAIERLSDWLHDLDVQRRPKPIKPARAPKPTRRFAGVVAVFVVLAAVTSLGLAGLEKWNAKHDVPTRVQNRTASTQTSQSTPAASLSSTRAYVASFTTDGGRVRVKCANQKVTLEGGYARPALGWQVRVLAPDGKILVDFGSSSQIIEVVAHCVNGRPRFEQRVQTLTGAPVPEPSPSTPTM